MENQSRSIGAFVGGLTAGAVLIGIFVGIAMTLQQRTGFFGLPPNAMYAR